MWHSGGQGKEFRGVTDNATPGNSFSRTHVGQKGHAGSAHYSRHVFQLIKVYLLTIDG